MCRARSPRRDDGVRRQWRLPAPPRRRTTFTGSDHQLRRSARRSHLSGINPSSVSYSSGHLMFSGGDIPLAIASGGTVAATANADGADGYAVVCFCANTLILTPDGERAVQDLAVGDLVTTRRGEAPADRVDRRRQGAGHARPAQRGDAGDRAQGRAGRQRAAPRSARDQGPRALVRRRADPGGVPGQPPVDRCGTTTRRKWSSTTSNWTRHDVLLANGAPAESYRDDGNRWLFQQRQQRLGPAAASRPARRC